MDAPAIAIIEDNEVITNSLVEYITRNSVYQISGTYESAELFLSSVSTPKPSLILLDIGLVGMDGITAISEIKKVLPDVEIMMLTSHNEEDYIFKALKNGATSYVHKRVSLEKILEAIHVSIRGGAYMSPSIARKVVAYFAPKDEPPIQDILSARQIEIVEHIIEGKSYNQISETCFISINTVRSHIKKIYKLLNVNNKARLISTYNKYGESN